MAQSLPRQIVAIGGTTSDGDRPTPHTLALLRFFLSLTHKQEPLVCGMNAAAGDQPEARQRFETNFGLLPCQTRLLSLYAPPTTDLATYILECDAVYVGGGSTRNMLALWREWGVDAVLRMAWERGSVLGGVSAGAICWFSEGITDSLGPLSVMRCMGFLPGAACPHYNGEEDRRPAFHRFLHAGTIGPGYAIDDLAALHVINTEVSAVVSASPTARAYQMSLIEGTVQETPLPTRRLSLEPSLHSQP